MRTCFSRLRFPHKNSLCPAPPMSFVPLGATFAISVDLRKAFSPFRVPFFFNEGVALPKRNLFLHTLLKSSLKHLGPSLYLGQVIPFLSFQIVLFFDYSVIFIQCRTPFFSASALSLHIVRVTLPFFDFLAGFGRGNRTPASCRSVTGVFCPVGRTRPSPRPLPRSPYLIASPPVPDL